MTKKKKTFVHFFPSFIKNMQCKKKKVKFSVLLTRVIHNGEKKKKRKEEKKKKGKEEEKEEEEGG